MFDFVQIVEEIVFPEILFAEDLERHRNDSTTGLNGLSPPHSSHDLL